MKVVLFFLFSFFFLFFRPFAGYWAVVNDRESYDMLE